MFIFVKDLAQGITIMKTSYQIILLLMLTIPDDLVSL